jgi:thioredoxin 1
MKLLRFSAAWCSPCHTFAPVLEAFAKSHGLEIQIIDCTKPSKASDAAAKKYGVMVLPTTVLVCADGRALVTVRGAVSRAELASLLQGPVEDAKALKALKYAVRPSARADRPRRHGKHARG